METKSELFFRLYEIQKDIENLESYDTDTPVKVKYQTTDNTIQGFNSCIPHEIIKKQMQVLQIEKHRILQELSEYGI